VGPVQVLSSRYVSGRFTPGRDGSACVGSGRAGSDRVGSGRFVACRVIKFFNFFDELLIIYDDFLLFFKRISRILRNFEK
jgi:hypothetical protein